MKRLPLYFLSSLLLIGLAGCERPKGPTMQQSSSNGPVTVVAIEVKRADLPVVIEATGQLQAYNTTQIYSRVAGYLQKQNYIDGTKVSEGDLLFTIDPSDFLNAEKSAKASLLQAQANYENAKATLERIKLQAKENAVSAQELDNAIANEKSAYAAVEVAKAQLSQAQLNLEYTKIKAPISGYADKRRVDIGTFVSANTHLTTLYQTDPIYVNFSLSENDKLRLQNALDSGKMGASKQLQVQLVLADGTLLDRTGTIDFTAPAIDTQTGTLSYRAILENHDGKLIPGQFVRVKILGAVWKNALFVPQKAVLTNEKGEYVYLVEANNTVSTRSIQIGDWVKENVVVLDGLKEGQKVVVQGVAKLRPGSQVKLENGDLSKQ